MSLKKLSGILVLSLIMAPLAGSAHAQEETRELSLEERHLILEYEAMMSELVEAVESDPSLCCLVADMHSLADLRNILSYAGLLIPRRIRLICNIPHTAIC